MTLEGDIWDSLTCRDKLVTCQSLTRWWYKVHMDHDKDKPEKRNVPPRSEFLSEEAHTLAQAEESSPAGYRYERRRKRLLKAIIALLVLLVGTGVSFWWVNRR